MVKGQARQQASAPSSSAAPQIPTMQTGQNIHDPLTQLNSHLGFGAMAGINPFADLGVNPNDPNMVSGLPLVSCMVFSQNLLDDFFVQRSTST